MINEQINPLDVLMQRGISQATIDRYKITPTLYANRQAVRYPTVGKGATGIRIKYTDGVKPKYIWQEHHDGCVYYSAGELVKAIAENDGLAYIVNGEAATWSFHSYLVATGKPAELAAPCISWFGEGSVPQTLLADLQKFEVKRTYLFLDCDQKGYLSALKVIEALGDMPCMALELPFPYKEKDGEDINDLWIKCAFDPNKMASEILATKMLTVEEIQQCAKVEVKPVIVSSPMAMQEAFRPATNGNGNHNSDVDFEAIKLEWIQGIIAALGAPDKREGKIDRWHCPVHQPDNNPSFRVDYEGKYPRPRCSCNIQDKENAWDLIAQAKLLPAYVDYRTAYLKSLPKTNYTTQPAQQMKAPIPNAPVVKRTFSKGSEVLKSLDTLVYHGDTSHIGNPVVFPFRSMHFMGGLCRHIPAGMLIGIGGGSGEGKTTIIETFLDYWNRGGLDVTFYSPEWTRELVMQRRIQRYSGYNGNIHVDVDAFTALTLWLKERDLGIGDKEREGSDFVALRDEYERVKKYLLNWQGEVLIACDDDPTEPMYLDTFLEMTADTIADARRQKRRADVAIVDYAQLAEILNANKSESVVLQVIRKIKKHATVHKYVGLVASQITKASSKAQKSGAGTVTSDDMQFLRSDQFNLCLTINRVFDEVEGMMQPTDFVVLYVDKNSLGRAKQKLRYRTDYTHLRWLDEIVPEVKA